jgi:glutamate racemase
MNKQPIGIFDSGVGGLSIWKEITQLLPFEDTIYLADSINAPYGEKSEEEIVQLCLKNTNILLNKGCKLIVVACNTATTNGIKILRNTYNIPFIGIEPAIKPATLKTKTNTIGILATKGTLNSSLFAETSEKHKDGITVIETVGTGLVPLVEDNNLESKEMQLLLESYIQPMLENHIDCLVLGCTHYPFLIPQIKKITGKSVEIIDSGLAVAKQTKAILEEKNIINTTKENSKHHIYSNTNLKTVKSLLKNSLENTELHLEKY